MLRKDCEVPPLSSRLVSSPLICPLLCFCVTQRARPIVTVIESCLLLLAMPLHSSPSPLLLLSSPPRLSSQPPLLQPPGFRRAYSSPLYSSQQNTTVSPQQGCESTPPPLPALPPPLPFPPPLVLSLLRLFPTPLPSQLSPILFSSMTMNKITWSATTRKIRRACCTES